VGKKIIPGNGEDFNTQKGFRREIWGRYPTQIGGGGEPHNVGGEGPSPKETLQEEERLKRWG